MPKLHARTAWCPLCTPTTKLVIRNKPDNIHAIKVCHTCKRYFRFIRTDTAEGRSFRMKTWRKTQLTIVQPCNAGLYTGVTINGEHVSFGQLPEFDAKTGGNDRPVPKGCQD